MRLWQLVRQAIEGVARSRLRSGLTALGVAIASGALVSMVAFALGLQAQMEAPFQQLGLLNNIEVRSRKRDRQPQSTAPPSAVLDEPTIRRLESLPGVEYAYPDLRLTAAKVIHGQTTRSVVAVGLPREATLVSLFQDLLVAGHGFSLADEPEALLGSRLAEKLGFVPPEQAIGQHVRLDTAGLVPTSENQFELQRQQLDVVVVGVYQPPSIAGRLGADSMLLPVDLMRNLPGTAIESSLRRLRADNDGSRGGVTQVIVHTKRPSDVARVEKAIHEMGFDTHALITQLKDARKFFVFMEVLLTAVGTVALTVAGLGIVNTLLMSVLERYQEIGIYKAIGASDHDIRILFLTEAAVVGWVGGLGGLVLARIVSWLIQWGVNQYAMRQGIHDGTLVLFQFPPWLLTGAVLFAIGVSIVSGLYPASRAARVDPIRALRGE